ncbi:MAG TPA: acyl carrier protein [Acholeplasmataceae bacterium]|jgi:acyl carrier protein|nr:acyl carrier protein [Acholeplasmataceae bacterium]
MIFDKVVDIVATELNVSKDEITMETDIQKDLGADSLDAVELMMALEDEFSIQISDEEAQNFATIKDIVSYLENR